MRTHGYKFLLLPLFCAINAVHGAFTIDPAVVTFNTVLGEKTAFVAIANTGNAPMAISLEIFERVLDLDGELDRQSMVPSKDFTIYPSEIILKPNENTNVQLMYANKQKVTEDKAYVLFSKEVPLSLDEDDEGGIKMSLQTLISYYTVIALETGKEGKLTFVSSKSIGGNKIEVIVENRSGGRVAAGNLSIKTSSDLITDFTGKKNSIMPGQKRRFTFKYLRPLTSKEVKFIY